MNKLIIPGITLVLLLAGCSNKKAEVNPSAPLDLPGSAPELPLDDRPARSGRKGSAEIAFFYLETCPSCDDYVLAEELTTKMQNAAKKGHFPWKTVTVTSNNVLTQKQVDELKEYIDSRNLPDVSLSLPLLFVNKEIVIGYEEIEQLIDGLIEF